MDVISDYNHKVTSSCNNGSVSHSKASLQREKQAPNICTTP